MTFETPGSEATRNRPKQARGLQTINYIAINAFLVFHILAISCWALPINNPLISQCRSLLRPYFLWSGLFQSWDMFSPTPKAANSYLEAIVIYKDRSTQLWSFPRMELLSLRERFIEERYRKYEENLQNNDNSDLWPDAARHIARLNNNGSNPPQKVMLVARWSDIIPRTDDTYDRGPWGVNVFFSYDVQPEDLK
jgi:hypothetical protein